MKRNLKKLENKELEKAWKRGKLKGSKISKLEQLLKETWCLIQKTYIEDFQPEDLMAEIFGPNHVKILSL